MAREELNSEMKDVAKHSAIFGLGNILRQGVSILLLPLYVSRIPIEDYGVLNLLLIGANLIGLMSKSAIGPAVFRSYYDYTDEISRKKVITTAMTYVFVVALIMTTIGCIMAKQVSWVLSGDSNYWRLTQLVLITAALMSLTDVSLTVFRVKKLSKIYLIISVSQMIISLVVVLVLVLGKKMGIDGVVIGRLIGAVLATVASLFYIRSELSGKFSTKELKKMLKYGTPHIPENLISFAANAGARLLLRSLTGVLGVGIYALGYRIASVVQSTVITPFNLVVPAAIFSMEKNKRANEFYGQLFFNYIYITGFLSVLAAVLTEPVLRLFAKPDYIDAWRIVPFLAFAFIAYGARGLVSLPLMLKRKTFWFPIAFASGAIVNLSSMLLLIPALGTLGAGVSLLLGNTVVCYVRNRLASHYMKQTLNWRRVFGLLVVYTVIIGSVYLVNVSNPILDIIIKLSLATSALIVLPRVLNLLSDEDLELIKEMGKGIVAKISGRIYKANLPMEKQK